MTAAALAVNSIALDMQCSEQASIVRKQTNSMGIGGKSLLERQSIEAFMICVTSSNKFSCDICIAKKKQNEQHARTEFIGYVRLTKRNYFLIVSKALALENNSNHQHALSTLCCLL